MKHKTNVADIGVALLLALLFTGFIVPFIHVVTVSLSTATSLKPGLSLWPRDFSLNAYISGTIKRSVLTGLKNSALRSIIGAIGILFINSMAAYVTSKDYVVGVKWIRRFFILTMYISGGIIPTYLVIRNLQMVGTFWVYIFPMMVTPFYMLLMRTYIQSIPPSLDEAARIDGAGYSRYISGS